MKDFIRIRGLSKHFGDFVAVDNVDLDIEQGELFSILGGSGCGKTTLLRMLAGFEPPTRGTIEIEGVDITSMPAYQRPVNMMFQSYAVFPHMTVEKNIAYGLRKDDVKKSELARRLDEAIDLVQLNDFRKRKPDQLSGGQQQRVALARALIKRPKVLLLDEPLAALDKKLREQTQFELMNIQDELGVTFVVVTHDQEEAMTLSTRIAVMEKGRFLQVGEPKEIYEYPNSRYVAEFIGTINTFEGDELAELSGNIAAAGDGTCIAIRPEKIIISRSAPDNDEDIRCQGIVDDLGYLGNLSLYRVRLESGKVILVSQQNRQRSAKRFIEWEERIWVSWNPKSSIVLSEPD